MFDADAAFGYSMCLRVNLRITRFTDWIAFVGQLNCRSLTRNPISRCCQATFHTTASRSLTVRVSIVTFIVTWRIRHGVQLSRLIHVARSSTALSCLRHDKGCVSRRRNGSAQSPPIHHILHLNIVWPSIEDLAIGNPDQYPRKSHWRARRSLISGDAPKRSIASQSEPGSKIWRSTVA